MNEGLAELYKSVFRFEAPCLLSFHVIMGLHLLIKSRRQRLAVSENLFTFADGFSGSP